MIFAMGGCQGHRSVDTTDRSAKVLAWAREQALSPATSRELPLPAGVAAASATGTVDVARTLDGRTCVLLKTKVGYKGNFVGIFRIDGPLRPGEIVDEASRPYLSLPGLAQFEELYIRSRTDTGALEVYFDLN